MKIAFEDKKQSKQVKFEISCYVVTCVNQYNVNFRRSKKLSNYGYNRKK